MNTLMRLPDSIRCFYNDENMYMSLSAWLESAGYDVSGTVSRGATDVEGATATADLIIVIRRDADGGAAGICRRLREVAPRTPMIVWSGTTSDEDLRSALDSGASAYVGATTSLVDLTDLIRRLAHSESA